ncbi:MAG: dihydrolipoyl dehydrogenase family protein [Bacillota bacterium]
MDIKKYDYIIIGSGPVAYKMAIGLKNSNKKILVVENDKFGGICPNYGCEPKIFLEGAVRTVLTARQLLNKGISVAAEIDWQQLMKYKKETFAPYPQNAEKGMQNNNADTINGTASFVNEHTLMINDEPYYGSKIIIATGQKPNKLPIKGTELTYSSNDVLSMEHLPKRVTFIGGGFVSMELATILNAAGSHVEIIEYADRPLQPFYSAHVKDVVSEMKAQGIIFHVNQSVSEVVKVDSYYSVKTAQGLIVDTDLVVDASGRIPNLERLNLENAGIEYDRGGILVNEFLETNVKDVYAAGDVASKDPRIAPKLTTTAHFEGEYLSENLESNNPVPIKYPIIGTASFTFPQIAQAGMNVDEALNNPDYNVITHDLTPDFFYTGTNDYNAKLTLVFDKTNKLVGASEVSQTAADDINNFVDVIGLNLNTDSWKKEFLPIFPALAYKVRDLI